MKNRKLNKVLLPGVALIWVFVLMRFVGSCSGEDAIKQTEDSFSLSQLKSQSLPDTFSLVLDYRDPFLDRLPEVARQIKSTPKPRKRTGIGQLVKKPVKKQIRIPKLSYQGAVRGTDTTRMTGILEVDRRIYTVKEGDSFAGLQLVEMTMDQLTIAIGDTTIQVFR